MQLKLFLDEAAAAAATGSGAADQAPSAHVPFDALQYTAGECNYGGRVTDDKDRLLLATILATCYCRELVDRGPAYSLSPSGLYHAPADAGRDAHLRFVDGLPPTQAPEAFGLHANAAITKDVNATELLLSSLLAASGGGGSASASASGAEAAATEARVAALIAECLERLPAAYDLEAVSARFPQCYEQSLNTVLLQEMARYNKLCGVLRASLVAIAAALQGLSVMSSELEAAYRSISLNQVRVWRVSHTVCVCGGGGGTKACAGLLLR
jgi:dynein heavy chain